MIDPDGIILTEKNRNNSILIKDIPEFDFLVWDLEDDKEFKKFIKTIESEIRGSFEYKQMVQYLKEHCGMNECAFLKVSGEGNNTIKIEIHHYPFTLYDIVEIVYRKRIFYQESLDVEPIAKECTMIHYKMLVGLISLSKTVHQLYHDNKLFIPVDHVFGRYQLFVDLYKPFCTTDQLDTLDRIEKYSKEKNDLHDTTILDTNILTYDVRNENFALPDTNLLEDKMNNQIEQIKKNNYRLPTLEDLNNINKQDLIEDRQMKQYKSPIFFFNDKK